MLILHLVKPYEKDSSNFLILLIQEKYEFTIFHSTQTHKRKTRRYVIFTSHKCHCHSRNCYGSGSYDSCSCNTYRFQTTDKGKGSRFWFAYSDHELRFEYFIRDHTNK